MIVSFLAGLVFGVGSGFFERLIGEPLRRQFSLSDSELTILSFGGLMLLAAILVSAMRLDSSAFLLVLGGVIGAFAIRGYALGKTKVEERRAQQINDAAKDTLNEAAATMEKSA